MGANMVSPNLITTSLGTQSANQISPSTLSLVVHIPREHTPFKPLPRPPPSDTPTSSASVGRVTDQSNLKPKALAVGGSRSKVLQNLAKKISQKSKKLTGSAQSLMPQQGILDGGHTQPTPKTCPSCGKQNTLHKKRCGYCLEFMVGIACPGCSSLNYYHAKTCYKCGVPMPWGTGNEGVNNLPPPTTTMLGDTTATEGFSAAKEQGGEGKGGGGGSGASDSSSHPTSPLSPKYSAPPIRSAVLKSLFPQVSGKKLNVFNSLYRL